MYTRLEGRTFTFSVSGTLERQVLVMEDRETHTHWSQVTGQAIVGPLRGDRLKQVPTQVLTGRAGSPASRQPPGTRASAWLASPSPGRNMALGAGAGGHSELVLGTRAGGAIRSYALSLLDHRPILDNPLGGVPIVVAYAPGDGFGLVGTASSQTRCLNSGPAMPR